jgi:hypothetical protein
MNPFAPPSAPAAIRLYTVQVSGGDEALIAAAGPDQSDDIAQVLGSYYKHRPHLLPGSVDRTFRVTPVGDCPAVQG